MADPITLALVAGGVALASTGFSVVQGIQKAKFDEKVAERDMEIAKRNQEAAITEGQAVQEQQDEQARAEIGALTASYGAAGVDLGLGSSLINLTQTRALARRDATNIRNQTNKEVDQFRQQEYDALARKSQAKADKTNVIIGGALDVGSTLLSGAQSYNTAKIQQAQLKRLKAAG